MNMEKNAENITEAAEELRTLRAALHRREEELRLIVGHSERVICYYECENGRARPWDALNCAQCAIPRLCEYAAEEAAAIAGMPAESREALCAMLGDIQNGVGTGSCKLHVRGEGEGYRWIDLRYSAILDEGGTALSAILSHKDVTEDYEHELAYLQQVQNLEEAKDEQLLFIECDLSANMVERIDGSLAMGFSKPCSQQEFERDVLPRIFLYDDEPEAMEYFSFSSLLSHYASGKRHLSSVWQGRYPFGEECYLQADVHMLAEPYDGHIKAFFRIADITREKRQEIAVRNRSERDSLSGLLNRITCEERIRKAIEAGAAEGEKGGILLLLDLDDLKTINDLFGHEEGDHALRSFAQTLQSHFRKSDVLGRTGGDEFMAFLPQAAPNVDAIGASLAALLRRLAAIPVGAQGEMRLHCSVGCAVQREGDSLEDMTKRADLALYHVKRSGKNSFAFYTPDMDGKDYAFRQERMYSLREAKNLEASEMRYLLHAISDFYPLIISANLDANNYYIMEAGESLSRIPTFGTVDKLVQTVVELAYPEERGLLSAILSRKNLLAAYDRGEKSLHCYLEEMESRDAHPYLQLTVLFYEDENGSACCFALLRRAPEREQELHVMWMQKVLELSVRESFEYVCLIDVHTRQYIIYGNDGSNTHSVSREGDFDDVTRHIRDAYIAPEERDAYYENANLGSVIARMQDGESTYSYRYNMPDGGREASFYWFESTHNGLLMVVKRV